MALLYLDGLDYLTTISDAKSRFQSVDPGWSVSATGGITGGPCLVSSSSNDNSALQVQFGATNIARVFLHFWVKYTTIGSQTDDTFLTFTTAAGDIGTRLRFNQTTGTLRLTPEGSLTNLATTSASFILDTWTEVEIDLTAANSGGNVTIKFDGVTVMNYSGDTTSATDDGCVSFFWYNQDGAVYRLDDIVIWDTSGTGMTGTMSEPIIVQTLRPSADTATADWVPNSGVTGYTQIDEATADGGTTYIEAVNALDEASFEFGNLTGVSPTVYGAQLCSNVRYEGAPGNAWPTFHGTVESGASSADLITKYPGMSYLTYPMISITDPDTASPWDDVGINAAKFGIVREV